MNMPDGHTRVYPWHRQRWEQLAAQRARLPHALLLAGANGIGKSTFASVLAHGLLCSHANPDGYGCGTCNNCHLVTSGYHPDLQYVTPAEAGKAITVDQIRALGEFLSLHAHTAETKIVVITPADAMNINAANSLLKILEEPPMGNLLLLVSSKPGKLPATVRSRCQRLDMRLPPRQQALEWLSNQKTGEQQPEILLELAGGAPLLALEMEKSGYLHQRDQILADIELLVSDPTVEPLSCAARWHKIGTETVLAWLQGFTADLLRTAMTEGVGQRLFNPDIEPRLQGLIKRLHLKELFRFFSAVSEARELASGPLDKLSLIEDILIRWYRMAQQSQQLIHDA